MTQRNGERPRSHSQQCPNCGAPDPGTICRYCKNRTGYNLDEPAPWECMDSLGGWDPIIPRFKRKGRNKVAKDSPNPHGGNHVW